MSSPTPIKSLLTDIGGVLASSPMSAIYAYEAAQSIPKGYLNYSIAQSPTWWLLERGKIPPDVAFFNNFTHDLKNPRVWKTYCQNFNLPSNLPIPTINGETLFNSITESTKQIDNIIYHAYKKIKSDQLGGVKILGALSNDYLGTGNMTIKLFFDVYVSSSESGFRKPEREIYELAVKRLSEESIKRGFGEVKAEEVVFLDDIGQNLKAAREMGMKTIKVDLGATWSAVLELEGVLGLEKGSLLEDSTIDRLKEEGKWMSEGEEERSLSKL